MFYQQYSLGVGVTAVLYKKMKSSSVRLFQFSDRFRFHPFVPARRIVIFRLLYCALFMAFLLPLVFGRATYSTARRLTAGTAQQCKSPGEDAIKSYDDAGGSARTALEELKTAKSSARSDNDEINGALEKVTSESKLLDEAYKPFENSKSETAPPEDVKQVLADYEAFIVDIQDQQKVGDELSTAIGSIPSGSALWSLSRSPSQTPSPTPSPSQPAQDVSQQDPQDRSTWTMASIDLFYYDDVARLIRVLSPNAQKIGGDQALQDNKAIKRGELDAASQTLLNADANVSDARTKVAKVEDKVRVAEAKVQATKETDRAKLEELKAAADAADNKVIEATDRTKRAQLEQTKAQREFDAAKQAAAAKPDDAPLQERSDKASQRLDAAKDQVTEAQADEDLAKDKATKARADVTAASAPDTELADLKTELTAAKGDLSKANTEREAATEAQRTALRAAFLAAQAENFAFAQARDNAPFWTNLPASGEPPASTPKSDPLSRVLLFGFPDSRTLFIRGKRDDIDIVRQIVKEFDKPAGQAMMTVRTMEISSDGTADGAKRTMKFLDQMNQELNDTQQKIDDALRGLRDAINKQVRVSVTRYNERVEKDIEELKKQRDDPATSAADKAGLDIKLANKKARLKLSEIDSIAFYDPEVMKALGWKEEFTDKLAKTNFLNAIVPHPSHTVTLAQALIVLSLATADNRSAVLANLTIEGHDDPFASLRHFIGKDGNSADALAFQPRLIEALRLNGITHVLESVEALVRSDLELQQAIQQREKETPTQEEQENHDREIQRLKSQSVGINEFGIKPMLEWLQGNTPNASPQRLRKRIEEALKLDNGTSTLLAEAMGLRRSARYRFSDANESAVNLTFRKYLEQVNRDLENVYVKPAFRRINEKLLKAHLGVGVIQEESILASNRLSARVDPKGSAQLAVGEEQNVLQAAQQLVNLFGTVGKELVNSATGSPQALAGGPAGGAGAGAGSVLNALDQMPRQAPPSVYGIATGNLFQVTPVIDPSGQALRFRFDFVSATQIREPNDTIDPQLPRIERHSINTEVYLSDQQIRLISQFSANSRLGVAKRTSGGFPILNMIPVIREIPLIGWFIKRGGRAAQIQHSFIFCHTAMYPTLSEVLDVSVQSPTFTGF